MASSYPSPMTWSNLLSTKRLKKVNGQYQAAPPLQSAATQGLRTEFHVDHDRIVFSSAFRRLGRKTQVHPFATHDHAHNRLTHSVEVACVGRSLGNRVGSMLDTGRHLPEGLTPFDIGSIVQVACLAHDIGNPPFGHTGEDALRDWFRHPEHAYWTAPLSEAERADILTYEGNAHGLRMVSTLEMYTNEGGMRLTCASLGCLVKYPWTAISFPEKNKFSIYQSELPSYAVVAEELGLIQLGPQHWARHPLSYLMEAADDICYAILDLEDAVEMGILSMNDFLEVMLPITEIDITKSPESVSRKCALLRGVAIGKCVDAVAESFTAYHEELLHGSFPAKDLLSVSNDRVRDVLQEAKDLANRAIYPHRTKLLTEIAAYPCIAKLLDLLIPAAHKYISQGAGKLSNREKLHLALLEQPLNQSKSLYTSYMRILDFLGSMTDNHAAGLAKDVSGIGIH